eukprot:gene12270-14383_t
MRVPRFFTALSGLSQLAYLCIKFQYEEMPIGLCRSTQFIDNFIACIKSLTSLKTLDIKSTFESPENHYNFLSYLLGDTCTIDNLAVIMHTVHYPAIQRIIPSLSILFTDQIYFESEPANHPIDQFNLVDHLKLDLARMKSMNECDSDNHTNAVFTQLADIIRQSKSKSITLEATKDTEQHHDKPVVIGDMIYQNVQSLLIPAIIANDTLQYFFIDNSLANTPGMSSIISVINSHPTIRNKYPWLQ